LGEGERVSYLKPGKLIANFWWFKVTVYRSHFLFCLFLLKKDLAGRKKIRNKEK